MKVFNLTDVETPTLHQYGLVNQGIVVGNKIVEPGSSEEVPDEFRTTLAQGLTHLVSVGALAIDSVPPSYASAKVQSAPAAESKKKNSNRSEG